MVAPTDPSVRSALTVRRSLVERSSLALEEGEGLGGEGAPLVLSRRALEVAVPAVVGWLEKAAERA